jgi:predicted kinase
MSLRDEFISWYFNEFRLDDLYLAMDMTSEESPWHRERTVGVHTDMVVTQYLAHTEYHHVWERNALCGAFAAAFHDVGKPPSMEVVYREDRGHYKRFSGHEPVSARLWEDWAVRNWEMLSTRFELTPEDMFRVGFIIERHLPWGLKDTNKRKNLILTLLNYGIENAFMNHLMADTLGRISDNADEKIDAAEDWLDQLQYDVNGLKGHGLLYPDKSKDIRPVLYVPIAASGSGKSTCCRMMKALNVFSLDMMRLERYGEPYDEAFRLSTEDKHFRSACNDRYREILRQNENVYLDNTNTSRKSRQFYITEARNRGFHIEAILMPVGLQTIIDRQKTRGDKDVPEEAVRRQYMGLSLPQLGEFDRIVISDHNL